MKALLLIITFFGCLSISANVNFISPPPASSSIADDTMFFDLQNAIYSSASGSFFLDLPVYLHSKSNISSFDFRMKFDQTKLTYITTNKIISQLDPLSYLNPNDGFLRTTTSGPSFNYVTPNNTPLIYLRFQLATSCTKIDVTDFNSLDVLMNSINCKNFITVPLASVSNVNLTSGVICSSEDISFTYPSTSFGRTITNYSWDFGNGATSILQNPISNFKKDGTYLITLRIITAEGCKDTIKKSLNVNPTPVSNFSYISDKIKDSIFFTNIVPQTNLSALSWEWNFGDQETSTKQNPAHQFSVGGSYTVSLITRTDIGCTNKYSSIIIIDKPTVNFTSSLSKCKGEMINFKNSSTFSNGSVVSWDWDFGDNTTSTSQNPTHVYLSSGTYTVKLIVTSNTGSKGTLSQLIVVNNKPIVQFEGDNLSGCSPLEVNFTNLSTTDIGSSYYWNFGDFIISSEQSPSHTFLSTRSYTIKQVVTSPGGCKDSLIKTSYITVLNSPISDFTTSSGCLNTVINFTDKSTVLSNKIISWDWSFGDNSTSALQNPTHIYTSNGSYTVTLKTSTNLGCSHTITKTIIINSKPIVQFDLTNSSGCMPLSVVFEDQSSTAVGSTSNWSFGDHSTSILKNPTHVYITDGLFTVKEVVVAPGGCSDSLIKTDYVNVLSALIPNFIDSNRCTSSPTIFKQKCVISTGFITKWAWDFGNGNSSSIENPTFLYTSPGKFNVKFTATTNQGCSNSIVKEVVIDSKPIVNFKGNKLAGCVPENFIFSNLSVAPDSSKYVWYFGDSTSVTGKNINHTYNFVDSFTVKCIVTSPQGCIDSLAKEKYISLKAAPSANFTFAENSKFYPDFSISFLNKSVNSNKYYWEFGDFSYSGILDPKHTYADSGKYEICLTSSSSEYCTSKVCKPIKIISSKVLALPTAFSPNGDSNNDVFKLLGGPCKELNFRIFNEWGNLIFESTSQELGWDGTFNGDILPMGTYNYSITGSTVDEKEINLTGFVNLTR